MRKTIILITTAMVLIAFGCDHTPESDMVMEQKTELAMQEANRQIGMPAITNFQERKLAKMIFELRDKEDLICYAYIVNWQGELVFLSKCVGYGLPYSIQYTNPQKIADYHNGSHAILPQADPNGLFMPEGLSATWLMLIDDKGNPHPVYVEQEILVSPFPLHEVKK